MAFLWARLEGGKTALGQGEDLPGPVVKLTCGTLEWKMGMGYLANGVLSFNKPQGMTSCEAVELVKERLKVPRAGHAGTLDLEASGLLPICLGKATKIVQFLIMQPKEYKCAMRLGIRTDTQDASGRAIKSCPADALDEAFVLRTMKLFQGEISQVPPPFSALKYRGQRLYNLARKGIYLEPGPRKIRIYELDQISINLPMVFFRVVCSAGTYIRTLCDDMGKALGVGAHLANLCRTRVGHFSIADSISPDVLLAERPENIAGRYLKPIDDALSFLPSAVLTTRALVRAVNGAPLLKQDVYRYDAPLSRGALFKVAGPKAELIGVAEAMEDQERFCSGGPGLLAFKFLKVLA